MRRAFDRTKIALIFLGAFASLAPAQSACEPITPEKTASLINYIRHKYDIAEDTSLSVVTAELISNTCFRLVTLRGTNSFKTWELKLYLSPDQRYLSSDLLDTTVDPVVEQAQREQKLMTTLAENHGTSMGPADAPVTIVEFSDFECPYCRRFSEMLQQILPTEGNGVRVVFHHMPLPMHPWARTAAEAAACAEIQSSASFWALHDQLFLHQPELNVNNIKVKVIDFAEGIKTLNIASFRQCIDAQMSLGLVLRDIDLATSNQVSGTPTLFINGRKVIGVESASKLRELITDAAREATAQHNNSRSRTGTD